MEAGRQPKEALLNELEKRRQKITAMGGPDRIASQRKKNTASIAVPKTSFGLVRA